MSDEAAVVMNEVTKVYGELTALDHLSLSLEPGHILGLIGPNGAGKTTAIKILVGLTRPTGGSARIAGRDCVRHPKEIKRLVGYMPDLFGSYDNMRVWEYLDFFGAAFGISRPRRVKRIDEVLDITGSTYMRDRYVESLSHGMKQRVGIARTLLHDPSVLILDEPANGLDPQARIEMRQLLVQLAKSGKTLMVTSHILPELSRICDQVAILNDGRMQAFGTLSEIMREVGQLRLIEVQLAGSDHLGRVAEIVRRHMEPDAEVFESPSESALRFRTDKTERELVGLLADLVGEKIEVSQFREIPADLEDAFLSVTRDTGNADNSSGAGGRAGSDLEQQRMSGATEL
ncbi:MAG: ABC transporter ATP-binding protein [Pirellulaceae bacterium]